MAENKKSAEISAKAFVPYIISGIIVIISYFIYNYVPESELANSIEQSSMTAVYLMVVAPVLCVIALILLALGFKKDKQSFISVYKNTAVYTYFGINALICIVCAILETSFVSSLFSLGFAAPNDGTVYETYGTVVLVCGILQLISSVLFSVKLKANVKK